MNNNDTKKNDRHLKKFFAPVLAFSDAFLEQGPSSGWFSSGLRSVDMLTSCGIMSVVDCCILPLLQYSV